MIFDKIWKAIAAQFNKLANAIRGYDPIAEMQYEYDRSVEQIREGREGLAQYRAMVERVSRQVDGAAQAGRDARGQDQGLSQRRRPRHGRPVRPGAQAGQGATWPRTRSNWPCTSRRTRTTC